MNLQALLAAAFLCLSPLLGAQPAAAQDVPPPEEPPIPPIQEEGDFYILNFSEDPEELINLEQFVNICQEATGLTFTYNDQTRTQLQSLKVFFYGTKRVPKEDFYSFFQILMFINEFVCVEVGPPHISVILIQALGGAPRGGATNIKQRTLHVGPDDLEKYADQPATLITTVLNLPNVDVRQLTTTMRGLLTDTNTQSILAAGEHSVILQGFGSYVASLAQLLYIVDRESALGEEEPPVFEVIPLEYAAAEDVADLIEQVLESRRSSRNVQQVPQQGPSGVLRGGDEETKILVDHRTQSLLVMAYPDEMPRIKDLIARLDVDVIEPERNFHIYSLQNVLAEDIAEVLDQFLTDSERLAAGAATTGGRPAGSNQGPAGGGGSSAENEVVVVEDKTTNSLLIAANKTRYEEVLELVRQLDRRQDQVLIETALIELSGTDFRDLGVELAFADVMGDGAFGATSFGLSDFQDSDDDGIPDLRVPSVTDGITAGILSGDDVNLPFLLAAVKRTDGSNVLNVPSVLVNNNGTAQVQTLDERPFETQNIQGATGTTDRSFGGYQEAGITMTISPSISASRYLRLDITLEVSTFRGAGTSTSPPPRVTRLLQTSVNVPDGDTMVIGGIITDDATDTRTSFPFLGDLPLLGWLFRRETNNNARTTLYFFVTPHIMKDTDFADLAEISYQKKLEAAEVIGRDRIRVVDPKFGRGQDEVDFEGFQVPLYRSPERGEVDAESIGLTPERHEELLRQMNGTHGGTPDGSDGAKDPDQDS